MHKNHRCNEAIKLGEGGKNNCAPFHLNFDLLEAPSSDCEMHYSEEPIFRR